MARRRFQCGCIFLRGKCPVWVARMRKYTTQLDGKSRAQHLSVVLGSLRDLPTERAARRRLDPLLTNINSLAARPLRVATVSDFADHWARAFVAHLKPSTQRVTSVHVTRYIKPLLGGTLLEDVSAELQQLFVAELRRRHGHLSRKTLRNILGTLSSMLTTARKWGYSAPAVHMADLQLPPAAPRATDRAFTVSEIQQILALAGEPWRTMFAIAALTGLRAGEILGLQVGDLDFTNHLLHVRRSVCLGKLQSPKSEGSAAALPMPAELVAIIRRHIASQMRTSAEGLLFVTRRGRPYNPQRIVERVLKPILRDKLNAAHRGRGFHSFRHAHSSLLLATGAPPTVAQKQLRHSDARITLAIYGHVVGQDHRLAVNAVAGRLLPDGIHLLFPTVPNSAPPAP